MFYPEVTRRYMQILSEKKEYAREFQELLQRTEAERTLYHGLAIPMTYQGLFLQSEQTALFHRIIRRMVSIGRKVTAEYVANPAYRPGFRFSPEIEKLILIDPGYDIPVPVGRYDIFYNGGADFRFCELNTDGASAMNEDRVLGGLLLQTEAMKALSKEWTISQFELFQTLVQGLLNRYRSIRGREAETVAIVDFFDKGTTLEFEQFQRTFEKLGRRCLICSPDEFNYEQHALWATDPKTGERLRVDLVYRRVVTSDFVERMASCEAFLQGYRDQAFVMFGSFRSQVMHSKLIFSMLYHPMTDAILTEEERAFVRAHVPMTRELLTEEDRENVRSRKDRYILKPYNSYASQGIYLGREYDQDAWNALCKTLPLDAYIYQDYVDVEPTPFIVPENGALRETRLGHVLGLFLYDEQFAGSYTRVGAEGIISGARAYFAAPVFFAVKK
ncbi:MAG: hypothetical protein SOR89_06600 [Ndongobacter sp.]|nr:hypothetical protein [Ndongobacter sp.]